MPNILKRSKLSGDRTVIVVVNLKLGSLTDSRLFLTIYNALPILNYKGDYGISTVKFKIFKKVVTFIKKNTTVFFLKWFNLFYLVCSV